MAIVPEINAWQIWNDDGRNTQTNLDLLVGTYAASYCDGAVLKNVDIEFRIADVTFTTQNVGDDITDRWYANYEARVTTVIPAGASVTLAVRRATRVRDYPPSEIPIIPWTDEGIDTTFTFDNTDGMSWQPFNPNTFPTPFPRNLLEQKLEGLSQGDGENFLQQTYWGVPSNEVSCAPPPPACTLEIISTTVTNETTTGSNDGSIEVFIAGSTGTTTYYLNNTNPQASSTFTSLAAGTYSVQVEEGDCFDEVTDLIIAAGEFRSGDFNVTEPNDFLASENPIITSLRTAYNGQPAFAQSIFNFSLGVADGSSVEFNLTSPIAYTAIFTAKDFPNRTNYFVTPTLKNKAGVQIGTNSAEEIATTFGEAVQKDIVLSRYYFVDVSGTIVTLTAKQATARMTLQEGINVTIAGAGITMNKLQDGSDEYEGSIISDYSLYTDVYVGDSTIQYGETLSIQNYDNYTSLELPYSLDNQHRFDASDVMKNFVSTPKIDLNFTGFTYITSMIRPFFIKYGENYPLVPNENTKKKRNKGDTGYKWVLNSSLEFEDANDVSQYFTGGKFLTQSPNPLQIQRNQTNFLYFIIPINYGQVLTLQGDIDFYDGTSATGQTFIDISTGATNLGGVYALNVSYDSLGLEAYETSGNTKIKRVTFAVYAGAVQYSEEKTYRFEVDEQPRKFGVSFLNVLGAYDTFDFVGVTENKIERVNKTYTVPRNIQSDGSSPVGFKSTSMYDTQVTKTLTVNSGWIDSEHFDWLIQLMSSNNIYSYTEDNQNYLNVNSVSYTKSSLDDLFELEITFKLTIFENNISI